MRRFLPLPLLLAALTAALTSPLFATAQQPAQQGSPLTQKQSLAEKTTDLITVDGVLNEGVWYRALPMGDFTQTTPNPGSPSTQRTEVRFVYDDEALYVGARMFDSAPDSILMQLSDRDVFRNTDEFGFWISPYNDGNNAFSFTTTPAGILGDMVIASGQPDRSWDAVWTVETQIDSLGWTAEFIIPWSAIRFPSMDLGEDQTWGANFTRVIRRRRETSTWAQQDPTRNGFNLIDCGQISGFNGISPPTRLAFYPYVSAYAETFEGNFGTSYNGGMDLKAGIGEAFTLDMTLVPDFGQVVADNLVLNLSPFEVQFAENRPFFTEGTEIFNKSGLFYSRRIGQEGKLINASKFSGRTSSGLGIGAFQAFTLDPATDSGSGTDSIPKFNSYSIAVLDQNLPNNSYVHAISTLVSRDGDRNNALVQGAQFEIFDKTNTYKLSGSGMYNKIYSATPSDSDFGHSWYFGISKESGKFGFSYQRNVESDTYNPNDLGYLQSPNEVFNIVNLSYRNIDPLKRFLRLSGEIMMFHEQLYAPRVQTTAYMSARLNMLTNSFQYFGLSIDGQPIEGRDYFAPRIADAYWTTPRWFSPGLDISTDYRKKFAVDINLGTGIVEGFDDWREDYYHFSPRYRVSDRLFFVYSYQHAFKHHENGWADVIDDQSIFGERDFHTRTHLLTATYAFSRKANIEGRVRHYWSTVKYYDFFSLQTDGSLAPYTGVDPLDSYDVNYNAWSVDLVFMWYHTPGSEVSIVWKNNLYSVGNALPASYFDNWEQMMEESFSNSLSVKALFYVDYNRIKRKLFNTN